MAHLAIAETQELAANGFHGARDVKNT